MKITKITATSRAGDIPAWFDGWLKARFGDHFSQISVDTTLKLKNAVKDVARKFHRRCGKCGAQFIKLDFCPTCKAPTFGFVPQDVEDFAKRFVIPPQGVSDHNFVLGYESKEEGYVPGTSEQGHAGTDKSLVDYIAKYPQEWEVVRLALGLGRQKSRHACAFLIANTPVSEFIPMTTVGGFRVTSFTAPAVEGVGGLKMDFLVVKNLKNVQDAIRLIQSRNLGRTEDLGVHVEPSEDDDDSGAVTVQTPIFPEMRINGRRVAGQYIVPVPGGGYADIWDLPGDQDVFADIAEGRTETVFQLSTPGARQWLKHFNYTRSGTANKIIDSVDAIAVFTALDRPGPLDIKVFNPSSVNEHDQKHNMLVEYARRARGMAPSPEIIKAFDELVPETFGVMVFQEQMQRVYQSLTGCTGSEAEEFRSNVAKKKKEKVDAALPFWMERAGAKLGEEEARGVWEFMKTWGRYGFNKSHAVCYATIAYASAWLKHHYPLEWWCAVLRNATRNDINNKHWRHCGHLVALPDVQKSKAVWVIEDDKLRAPFTLLHGIGEKAHRQLCSGAPYSSMEDFVEKILQYRADNRTTKKSKTGEDETVLGRSPVTRDIVHRLIVAGAMDSMVADRLTPAPGALPELELSDPMDIYDDAMFWMASKRAKETKKTAPKESASWKRQAKPAKKREYPVLDPIGRYQTRKSVLPAYGADLRPVVADIMKGDPALGFLSVVDGKRMRYHWNRWNRDTRREVACDDPVIGGARLEELNSVTTLPEGGFRCAVIACVDTVGRNGKRTFSYQGTKEACQLTLDVGGSRFEFVHWPDHNGKLPQQVLNMQPGTIVAALLVRNDPTREFSIKELHVIRPPLAAEEEKEDDEKAE